MSRPFSRIKLGYYPLPLEEAKNIRRLVIPSGAYSAADPCAGDGSALMEITKGSGAHLAAIELDADRAAACAAHGIATTHGSASECRVPQESCSLLYLNPPYDTELGRHNNQRMELVFLEHCFRWVITAGVLAFVIPITGLVLVRGSWPASLSGSACFGLSIQIAPDSSRSWCLGNARSPMRAAMRTALMRWCTPAFI